MRTDLYRPVLLLFFGILVATIGCGRTRDSAVPGENILRADGAQRIRVVCTTNLVKDLVQQIGGDRVDVFAIMDGPGVDPHRYAPSPQDTNALTSADVVVYSGLHLEGQFDQALESLEHRDIPVICVTDGLRLENPSRLIQSDEGPPDPHVWFDPDLWSACGRWLAAELAIHDPDGKDDYFVAGDAFAGKMQAAKEESLAILKAVPDERRILVTAHDAFEYFARAFDFEVRAVQGISTDSEPGLKKINELIEFLVSAKISAVFTEQSASDRNITALVTGCEARGHQLQIGARLFSDTAGAEGTAEETLSGTLLFNVRQIADALGTASASDSASTADEVEVQP